LQKLNETINSPPVLGGVPFRAGWLKLALSNDFEEIKSFIEKIGIKRQGETRHISPPPLSGALATANRQSLDWKLLFDFKKPFDLIPHFIFSKKNKSCNTIKNIRPISQQTAPQLSSTIDKDCRLKSPIIAEFAENSHSSVGGKIPPDFLSKNRLNRQEMLIENDRNCRLRKSSLAEQNGEQISPHFFHKYILVEFIEY